MNARWQAPDKRAAFTGRSNRKRRFAMIDADVIYSVNWSRASKPCRGMIADIAVQYSGHNNGDLTASRKVMRRLGWTSPGTLKVLLLEAEHYGLLVQTRQGGLLVGASLYALGWRTIDPCIDRKTGRCKLDDPGMVGTMPGRWNVPRPKFQRPQPRWKRKNAGTQQVPRNA